MLDATVRSPAPAHKGRSPAWRGVPPDLDLDGLEGMTRTDLKARWKDTYGTEPPARISRKLLLRAAAYRLQEEAHGGLPAKVRKRLSRAAEDLAAGRPFGAVPTKVKPGTRLLREWQGSVHEVVVHEDSVLYRGKSWPSLSAVAREITGARWSGPRFFGLKAKPDGRG